MSLNSICNLNCTYCYVPRKLKNSGHYLSLNDFNLLLPNLVESRVMQVALGGGEPTLHPNFIEILRRLRIEGNIIPNYTTNGCNLTEAILDASKKYCGAVAVSYSEKRENETLIAIQKLLENDIRTHLNIILLKSCIKKLANIVEKYAKLGISNVIFLF